MATREPGSQTDSPVKLDPKHHTVEFENDRVLVLRVKYGPHEKSVMHRVPDMITVSLTDRDIKLVLPNGRSQRVFGKAGEVGWYDAREHCPENMSAEPYEGIHIFLKDLE